MQLTFAKHEKLDLKRHSVLNEQWLHDTICDDPSILGLGDVELLTREKTLPGGGRLDLILFDDENERRYEVEVMLGATDPSHIIRTIEYWDIERRRYPGLDHVAVLIAENITSRFLNVLSLMAGTIPIMAIQLDALKIENQVLLNFVKVLDQAELRTDDGSEIASSQAKDREFWIKKAGTELIGICDQVLDMINESSKPPQELNYLGSYIGLKSNGVVNNIMNLHPKSYLKTVYLDFRNIDNDKWKATFERAALATTVKRNGRLRVAVKRDEFDRHRTLISEAVRETVATNSE